MLLDPFHPLPKPIAWTGSSRHTLNFASKCNYWKIQVQMQIQFQIQIPKQIQIQTQIAWTGGSRYTLNFASKCNYWKIQIQVYTKTNTNTNTSSNINTRYKLHGRLTAAIHSTLPANAIIGKAILPPPSTQRQTLSRSQTVKRREKPICFLIRFSSQNLNLHVISSESDLRSFSSESQN